TPLLAAPPRGPSAPWRAPTQWRPPEPRPLCRRTWTKRRAEAEVQPEMVEERLSSVGVLKAGLAVFAWPILLHLLFVTARRYDDLLQNLLLRLLLYVGSSVVLVRLPAAPDVRSMKLALARVLTPMIEPFVPESWIARKLAGFFAGLLLGFSRAFLAFSAVNFGARVLPKTWSLDLSKSEPYLMILDANGDGRVTADEVFSFVFRLSRQILGAAMSSIVGYQVLKLKRPPKVAVPATSSSTFWPVRFWCRMMYALQNPREAKSRLLARRVMLVSRVTDVVVVVCAMLWPWLAIAGLRPQVVLALGGVGGLAVGLAARNVVGNLIAGALIQLNRPFVEGDEIRLGNDKMVGMVEEIGPINTHLNGLDGMLVHIPNQNLLKDYVVNKTLKDFRPIREEVRVLTDMRKLPELVESLQSLLLAHEGLLQEEEVRKLKDLRGGCVKVYPPFCGFGGFDDVGAKIVIDAYTRGSISSLPFKRMKSQLLLQVSNCIIDHGAQVAFIATHDTHTSKSRNRVSPLLTCSLRSVRWSE
ncbi:MSL1, partial [Symbiodinium sp. KB8]